MFMVMTKCRLIFFAGMLACGVLSAQRSPLEPTHRSTVERPKEQWQLSQQLEYMLPAELDGVLNGDVSHWTSQTRLGYRKAFDNTRASFSVGYGYRGFDWDNFAPLEHVQRLDVGLQVAHQFSASDWGGFAMARLEFAGEADDGALWDGRSMMFGFGPTYQFSRDLTFGGGLIALDSPEREVRFFPIIRVDWRINDHWRLETAQGATLTYDFDADGEWVADVSAEYQSDSFRARDLTIGGRTVKPIVEEDAIRLEAGLRHAFNDVFQVRAYTMVVPWREYTLRSAERDLSETDVNPALGFGLEGSLRF